jgi:hypothetical protein
LKPKTKRFPTGPDWNDRFWPIELKKSGTNFFGAFSVASTAQFDLRSGHGGGFSQSGFSKQ